MIDLPVWLIKLMGMRLRVFGKIVDTPGGESERYYWVKLIRTENSFESMTERQFIETMDALNPETIAGFAKKGKHIYFGGVASLSEYKNGGYKIG